MKQVDVLTPVGISPPGLGPPDPTRLLALDTASNSIHKNTEGGSVSVLAGDLTDAPKAGCVATAKSDRFGFSFTPTSVEPYTGLETKHNAHKASTAIPEHIQNSPGHINERLAEDSRTEPVRQIARRSAIRKVQPAQINGKVVFVLVWSVALTL